MLKAFDQSHVHRSPIFNYLPSSPILDPEVLRRLEPAWMAAVRAMPGPAVHQLLGPFSKLKVIPRV